MKSIVRPTLWLILLLPVWCAAGVTVYEDDDTRVEVGGRIQVQYRVVDADAAVPGQEETVDDLAFRRLRPYMEFARGDWEGIIQIDFGDTDYAIKDAFIAYNGNNWGKLTLGNHYVPFSREQLTSSKRQQLVERTFVGDHDFGVPDRQFGVSMSGGSRLGWALGLFKAGIDPSVNKVDFVTTGNDDAAYSGNLLGGRLEFYPHGNVSMAQGDFDHAGFPLVGIGVNAYTWDNDNDDVVDAASDYDAINGIGIDGAIRWRGWSVDVAWQTFSVETLDSAFTGGLIESGEGDFDTWAVEGGYMLVPSRLEIVAGYQVLDADALDDQDRRISLGLNYFFDRHNTKVQLTWEVGDMVFDVDGNTIRGEDQDRIFIQLQHVL